MDFSFQTIYDHAALTAIARALRKTYRKKNSLITRIFMVLVLAFGIYSSTPLSGRELRITAGSIICYVTLLIILVTLLWEDGMNAMFAKKRLPRKEHIVDAVFDDDGFTIGTGEDKMYCAYQRINHLAETKYFYIFIFGENRAEIFDKDGLAGISEEEFRDFICKKTEMQFKKV